MDVRLSRRSQVWANPRVVSCAPLLIVVYTESCSTVQEGSYFVNFSDRTALLTLL